MRAKPKANKAPSSEPMILFTVGHNTFAIAASAVEEIRDTSGLKPLAGARWASNPVQYEFSHKGRTHYVVDANLHFGILPSSMARVLVLRDCSTAVLVGRIDRMTEIGSVHALPLVFIGKERQWFRGLALLGSADSTEVVPVVHPNAFLEHTKTTGLSSTGVARS